MAFAYVLYGHKSQAISQGLMHDTFHYLEEAESRICTGLEAFSAALYLLKTFPDPSGKYFLYNLRIPIIALLFPFVPYQLLV